MNYNLQDILELIGKLDCWDKVTVNVGKIPYKLKNDHDELIDIWFDEDIDNWVSIWKINEDKEE